jgi:flagellar biosynthetic protein FlhB
VAEDTSKDEKTEDATPKRREDAREEGQVAMSQEFVSALMLAAGIGALLLGGGRIGDTLGSVLRDTLQSLATLGTATLDTPELASLLRETVLDAAGVVVVLFLPVVGVGLVVGYAQIGFRISPKAVQPDPSKLDPIKGLKRLFSLRSWMRTGLSALKITAIASSMIAVAWTQLPNVIRMGSSELGPLLVGMGHVLLRATLAGVAAMVLISIIDLVYQRMQHDKDLRMTKEEVKEEHKTTEGDPHVKARVRALQREASRRRMMSEVPNAAVVVTNPDHYAVALSYERDERGEPKTLAPRVVAKGADLLAQRIKQVARDAGVLCYEDVPLARTLYAEVEIGEEIPEDMYAAVAAVLNYVYRVQGSLVGA